MKVLVTGAGAVLGQGVIRSLRASTLPSTIIAADPSPLAAGLYWADAYVGLPLARDPSFATAMARLIEEHHPDAVIPGTDVELETFARHRGEWEARFGTKVIVSSPDVVAIADDKFETFRFLSERGFGVPDSCLPADRNELVERVGFPLIVKPRIGARSIGVVRVETHAQLEDAVRGRHGLVVQECVGTDQEEFTAGALVFDGSCAASIVMRRELRNGNTARAFVDAYPDLNREVCAMAEALGAHGPVNFQFRTDHDGRVRVFEINSRFSGTTPFRMHAGFNEVEMVLRHVVYGEPITAPRITPMTIVRHFEETVIPAGAPMK